MRDMPRAALLDLDGTIVDAAEGIVDMVLVFAREQGLEEPSRDWLRAQIGKDPVETWRRMGGSEPEVMSATFAAKYGDAIAARAVPTPGARDALDWLVAHDVAPIAVTTRTVESARRVLEATGLLAAFVDLYGRDLVSEPKPSPQIVELALSQHHLLPSHAVMVGDTTADVGAARGADVTVFGVLGGIGTEQELRDAGADFILAGGVGELPDALASRSSA